MEGVSGRGAGAGCHGAMDDLDGVACWVMTMKEGIFRHALGCFDTISTPTILIL